MKPFLTLTTAVLLLTGCRTVTERKISSETLKSDNQTELSDTSTTRKDSTRFVTDSNRSATSTSTATTVSTDRSTRITEIEVLETFFNEMVDLPTSGMSIHPPTGRTVKTTTRIKEQNDLRVEKRLEEMTQEIESLRAELTYIETEAERVINQKDSEIFQLERQLQSEIEKKQTCFPCYLRLWWLWLIILALVVWNLYKINPFNIFRG